MHYIHVTNLHLQAIFLYYLCTTLTKTVSSRAGSDTSSPSIFDAYVTSHSQKQFQIERSADQKVSFHHFPNRGKSPDKGTASVVPQDVSFVKADEVRIIS